MSLTCELDHLVWGAVDLHSGVRRMASLVGAPGAVGGRHPGLGSRNHLWGLKHKQYLEVLAADPEQNRFSGFGAWVKDLSHDRLLTWAARTTNLEGVAGTLARAGLRPGPIESFSRHRPDGSELGWRLMMTEGHPYGPLLPFFIQWRSADHPCNALDAAARLSRLLLAGPRAPALEDLLEELGLGSPAVVCLEAEETRLTAELSVESGSFQLDSRPNI